VKEVELLKLLFIEEPCPPETVQAMAKSYMVRRELIEMGVIDILQTDINHVGGISGLWKVCSHSRGVVDIYGAACL